MPEPDVAPVADHARIGNRPYADVVQLPQPSDRVRDHGLHVLRRRVVDHAVGGEHEQVLVHQRCSEVADSDLPAQGRDGAHYGLRPVAASRCSCADALSPTDCGAAKYGEPAICASIGATKSCTCSASAWSIVSSAPMPRARSQACTTKSLISCQQ